LPCSPPHIPYRRVLAIDEPDLLQGSGSFGLRGRIEDGVMGSRDGLPVSIAL